MAVAIQSDEKLYTTPEAAQYLGMPLDSVRRHIQRGNIRPMKKRVGQNYLITESELDRFNENRRPRGNPAFYR